MEKEKEAGKILEEAKAQAARIEQAVREKAKEAFNEAYEQTIADAKRKASELKKKAMEVRARAHEAEMILRKAEGQTNKIRVRAKSKFEEAVSIAFGEITSL